MIVNQKIKPSPITQFDKCSCCETRILNVINDGKWIPVAELTLFDLSILKGQIQNIFDEITSDTTK